MRTPLVLPRSPRAAGLGRSGAALPWSGAGARLLPWALLGAIIALALALRLYHLDGLVTYYPDSYAQLRAVDNLLAGNFPTSYLYPPGIALFLAPAFAVLPNTLVALQATILVASIALVLLAYVAGSATTGDRRAALFFATTIALGAPFVYYSRATLFDVVNTLLIALTIFVAPLAARRGGAAYVAYGALVFVAITVRFSNVALLPALFLAAMPGDFQSFSWRDAERHLRSRAVLTALLTIATLYAVYLALSFDTITRFTNPQAGSVIDFRHYLPRLVRYIEATFIGYGDQFYWQDAVAAVAVFAFAATGARRLWSTNRSLVVPLACIILLWPPVHAAYNVFAGRYAMPAFFCVMLLAAAGLSRSITWWRGLSESWQRVGAAALLTLGVTFFLGRHLALDTAFLEHWPGDVASGREVAYDEVRDTLRGLDGPNSTLISSQALAVDRANPQITTLDLIRHSETYGINQDSIDRLLAFVREQQAAGRTVYFHYTEFEDVGARFRKYELGFDAYFTALEREYRVREIMRAGERVQRLYVLEPK